MPVPDPVNPDTAVRVTSGDTLSAIAKANNLTLSEIRDLNPKLMSNPKYNNGNTIFSNTKINIAPATSSTSSSYSSAESLGLSDRAVDERQAAAAEAKAAQDAMRKALEDQAAADKAAADAAAEAARLAAEEAARLAAEEEARRLAEQNGRRTLRSSLVDQPPNPTPSSTTPPAKPPAPPPLPIKTAPIDAILFDDLSVPIEIMTDLIFEDIGGQELINIARSDTVNGQQVLYQPIKNLGLIQRTYNPNNILELQQTSNQYFQNFPIKLEEKVPIYGSGPNGENIYIDSATGDLIIELINILEGEQVESQISIDGTIYEGTI